MHVLNGRRTETLSHVTVSNTLVPVHDHDFADTALCAHG